MAFSHRERYRVRYDDLDTYRHVNNKAFITYIEDARGRYLGEAAGFSHHGDATIDVMIVHFSIDYRSQVHYGDEVVVETRCSRIGNRSFTLEHRVNVGNRLAAEAESIIATLGEEKERAIPVPGTFAAAIRSFEGDPGL